MEMEAQYSGNPQVPSYPRESHRFLMLNEPSVACIVFHEWGATLLQELQATSRLAGISTDWKSPTSIVLSASRRILVSHESRPMDSRMFLCCHAGGRHQARMPACRSEAVSVVLVTNATFYSNERLSVHDPNGRTQSRQTSVHHGLLQVSPGSRRASPST